MSNELVQELVEALIATLVVIVPILFAILTRYLVKVLNAKAGELDAIISASNNMQLRQFADLVVDAAEQLIQLDTGEKQMAYAKMQLKNLASGIGVELSDRDAIALIEGTLGAISREIPTFFPIMEEFEGLPYDPDGSGI